MADTLTTGPRILCLDGGGIRGLSEILIIKELMLQVRIQANLDFTPEPRQCFDFICGTSTGGLLAVLLGRLGKSLDECEVFFREFGPKIFSGGSFTQKTKLAFTGSKHASANLKLIITGQAGDRMMVDESTTEVGDRTPVAVVAVSQTTGKPDLFRTYGVRATVQKCTIIDSCLATSAATTFFDPVTINGIMYVDGGFGYNNPSSVALDELESNDWLPGPIQDAITGIGCFVSIGTGRPTYSREEKGLLSYITPKGVTSMKVAAAVCIQIATNCHEDHLKIEKRFTKAKRSDSYFRFDVDRGLEKVEMNESSEEALQHITSTSNAYLQERKADLVMCAAKINPRTRGNTSRVLFEPFDVEAEGLSDEDFQRHYNAGIGFRGQLQNGPWFGRIADGVFRVTSDASGQPMINSIRYMANIDGHYTDLRDCIVSVAVKTERPYHRNSGAGLVVRFVDTANDNDLRGIILLKEPGRCCSIFYFYRGKLNRQASYSLSPLEDHNHDTFETMKIKASGNRVTFIVNGKVVAEKDDTCLEGSACVALIALGPGTFYFDDLELWLTQRDENLRSIS